MGFVVAVVVGYDGVVLKTRCGLFGFVILVIRSAPIRTICTNTFITLSYAS